MITRVLECLGCVTLLSGAAFSQATQASTFEAADVHVSVNARRSLAKGGTSIRDGRYEMRKASMVDLITAAYGVRPEYVVGGPSWLELDRFDVIAKTQANATPEEQRAMLQALLADRFKLAVHKDTQPIAAFALTAGKHPALKKADDSKPSGCEFVDQNPRPGEPVVPFATFACTNLTMQAFADELVRMNRSLQYQPVVDQTELEGAWDFTFKYTLPGSPLNWTGTITFFEGVEKLGLKLSPAKVPQPVIVVDRVNRKPTDNAPGVMEILKETPPPTEFEVADVKPSNPDRGVFYPLRIQPGGRVTSTGMTLKFLIEQAWNITDGMLIGAPEWLDRDTFDIIAKAPSGDVDQDAAWLMIGSLLKERFHLAVHLEDRVVPAYALLASKPKLKKADPNSRTRYQAGPAPDEKDPRIANPALTMVFSFQHMTMAQFAERLQGIALQYVHSPVVDATGLEGAYDFTLSFSRPGQVARAGRGGDNPALGAVPQASDPNGAVSLFEAVEKQLGLKLELQKRKVSVLVIDHIDQKPTDN